MTEFPADQPAEHPTGFPVESEPQGRPDPETEPGVGGEPDFDSEPDRGTTDFLAPSNNPGPAAADATDDADDSADDSADDADGADDTDDRDDADGERPPEVAADLPSPIGETADAVEAEATVDACVIDEADEGVGAVEVDGIVDAGVTGGVGVADGVETAEASASGGLLSDVPGAAEAPWGSNPETPWEPDAESPWDDDASTVDGSAEAADGGGEAVEVEVVSDDLVAGAAATPDIAEDGERGHPVVGETVERLEELRHRPVSEHAEVYADLHERLQSALAEADRADGEHTSERV